MSAIIDISEAWKNHTGLEVETFLKQMLGSTIASLGGKIGFVELVGSTLNFYDEEGGNVISTISLSGDVYNISIDANLDQVFYVLADETSKILTFTPSTRVSPFGSSESQPFPESYSYVISVNNGNGYVPRATGNIASGESASVDIRPFLANGNNYIRVTVTGDTSTQVKTSVFTGTLTTLTLTVAHAWQNAWAEGQDYTITGIRFAGNLVKTLHCSVDGTELATVVYNANQSYTTTATTYVIPASAFPASENGIHEVKLWMTAQGVSTPEFKFNIMCVAEGDDTPMVAVNAIVPTAVNWTTGRLFSYAVFGADEASFDLTALLGIITYPVATGVVATGLVDGQVYDFAYSLEIDTGVNETPSGTLTVTATAYFEGVEGDTSSATTALDNTFSYLATPGALFYMNASVRSNSEAGRDIIVNEMGASQDGRFPAYYEGVWDGFSWLGDGWDKDSQGNRALRIPAGASLSVPDFAPLSVFAAYPEGMTIEVMMKNEYPADYDTPILTLASEGADPLGITIYPTKIVVLGTYERSLVNQTVNISENRMTHLVVTFVKGYEGVSGRNLVSVYVNGISNVNFSFDASTSFGDGGFKVGQQDTDVFIYRMRVYGTALDSQAVFNNFLNSVIDGVEFVRRERTQKNDILEGDDVDYTKVKAAGYNTMVVTMTDDSTYLPSIDHPAPSDGYPNCSMRFEYAGAPQKNVTVSGVSIDGQGTTSKKYYRWNLRAKTKSSTTWEYGDGTTETGKKGRFINDSAYIKCDRITAKKNYASSMQGHKMGFTGLYNDLYKQCGLGSHLPSSDYRVAVFQFPFVGFRYHESNDTYEFIGIYTAGPDKGSKATFGYSDDFMSLMSIEGPNHAPRGTRFLHPWVDVTYDPEQETLCFGGEEGWDADYVNYETSSEGTQADWDAIRGLYESEWRPAYENVYNNSPHIASLAEVIAAVNNPSITTLADVLNPANAELITGTTINGYLVPIGVMEFYDTSYERYFFRTKTGQFESLASVATEVGDVTLEHNLLTDLAGYLTTQTPNTAQIVAARKARFKATASAYWDIDQTLFHYCFLELFAVSDNHAKNSYPFKFLPLSATGAGNRWGWRQDDMDTVMMTDNNGNNTKSYSVEPGDVHDNVQIFQGFNSALWLLVHDDYQDEIRNMMLLIVNSASAIATSLGISGDGLHGSLFNLTSYYCWEHSAKYFAETLYEKDRRWSYIQPWLENPTKEYNSVLPLTQALGDQYQAERLWMERRIAYMFSKYRIGAFNGATEGYNEIAFTLARQFTFELTPAIDLYPTAATGSTTVRAGRTEAKHTALITLDTTGDTTNYIKGGDWLASLGDLCGMVMTARGGGDISFSVVCARLLLLKIGDEVASSVLFNADTLSVSSPSITYIDARNTATVRNLVNLMNCPRLRTVLFAGSGASGMLLPVGAKVTEVSFPAVCSVLFLHSLPFLDNEHLTLPSLAGIASAYINNNGLLNAMTILQSILDTENNVLAYVTAVWEGSFVARFSALNTLAELTELDGSVSFENGAIANVLGIPLVEGTIDISQSLGCGLIPTELTISSDESYSGENIRRMWISNFNSRLAVIYDKDAIFPDPFVDDGWVWCYYEVTTTESATTLLYHQNNLNSLYANFIIDGVEVPKTQTYTFSTLGEHLVKMKQSSGSSFGDGYFRTVNSLRRVYFPSTITTINQTAFYANTDVTHIYFPTTITTLGNQICQGCSKLKAVNLGDTKITRAGGSNYPAFNECSVLSKISLPKTVVNIPQSAFSGCRQLTELNLEELTNLTSVGDTAFNNSGLRKVKLCSAVTYVGGQAFLNCSNLREVDLRDTQITRAGNNNYGAFGGGTNLEKLLLPPTLTSIHQGLCQAMSRLSICNLSELVNVTSIGAVAFLNCTLLSGELILPSLTSIGNQAFQNTKLTKVVLEAVVTVGYNVFAGCSTLREVIFGEDVTSIGQTCFQNDGNLVNFTIKAITPPTLGTNVFQNANRLAHIYVPAESVDTYKAASNWSTYASKITAIPEE